MYKVSICVVLLAFVAFFALTGVCEAQTSESSSSGGFDFSKIQQYVMDFINKIIEYIKGIFANIG